MNVFELSGGLVSTLMTSEFELSGFLMGNMTDLFRDTARALVKTAVSLAAEVPFQPCHNRMSCCHHLSFEKKRRLSDD